MLFIFYFLNNFINYKYNNEIICLMKIKGFNLMKSNGLFYLINLAIFFINIIFSIIGFYIAGIPMMPLAQGKTWLLKFFLELIFYIPVAAVLTVIPALIINVLMWLIMNIFGKQ